MKNPIALIFCLFISITGYSTDLISRPGYIIPPTEDYPIDHNVKGFTYNIVALKGESIGGAGTMDFSGRLLLDCRKSYKANFKKKEHFFFDNFSITDGQLYILPGYNKPSKLIKHNKSKDYYVALKFGNAWSQYTYSEIMKNRSKDIGTDLGLKNCNFKKEIYDYDTSWKLTAYFEIKPIYYDASKAEEANKSVEIRTSGPEQMPIIIDY